MLLADRTSRIWYTVYVMLIYFWHIGDPNYLVQTSYFVTVHVAGRQYQSHLTQYISRKFILGKLATQINCINQMRVYLLNLMHIADMWQLFKKAFVWIDRNRTDEHWFKINSEWVNSRYKTQSNKNSKFPKYLLLNNQLLAESENYFCNLILKSISLPAAS